MDFIQIPIPITKLKITKEKWLKTPIKYDNKIVVKDIIEEMCERTYSWIESKQDIDIISDYSSFEKDFINLLYNKYLR